MMYQRSTTLLLLMFLSPLAFAIPGGIRASIKHVDYSRNFSTIERVHRSVQRSINRLDSINARPTNGNTNIEGPVYSAFYEYIMDLSIGTPPQSISAIIDTGSDLIWTQCQPCDSCRNQNGPLYAPSLSSTYISIACTNPYCQIYHTFSCTPSQGCQYSYSYGTGSTDGVLGAETFTFGTEMAAVPSIVFGCSKVTATNLFGSSGLIGLSPGPLSLVNQLSAPRFSYCLDLFTSESSASTLLLGSAATMDAASGVVQSTPFVDVGSSSPPYYYISLTGISLGDTLLPIPTELFQFEPGNRLSGTIIDCGASVSFLTQQAYDIVKQAIISVTDLPQSSNTQSGLDLCFDVSATPAPSMPKMTFHFDGADMVVPYMYLFSENNLFCLMMLAQSTALSSVGNFQQQDMLVLYDIAAQKLSFAPAQCQGI